MELVDQPYLSPGCCVLSNLGGPENGPYIDLQREDNYGNRMYVCLQYVKDMARFIGGGGPEEMAAIAEVVDGKEELEAKLEQALEELEKLRAGVAMTLSVGAVFDKRTMRPRLRKPPAGMILAGDDDPDEDASQTPSEVDQPETARDASGAELAPEAIVGAAGEL